MGNKAKKTKKKKNPQFAIRLPKYAAVAYEGKNHALEGEFKNREELREWKRMVSKDATVTVFQAKWAKVQQYTMN